MSNLVIDLLNNGHKIVNIHEYPLASLYYVDGVLMNYDLNRDFFEAHYEADTHGLIVTRATPKMHVWDVVMVDPLKAGNNGSYKRNSGN